MWLPVTKNTSNEPSANCYDINTAKMRCLTKCIAVCFGLGAEVYNVDMLQEFKTEKVEGSKRISNSPSNGVTNPSLPKDSEPSPVIANPDAVDVGDMVIKCGYNKGETYSSYVDVKQVRKDLAYWNSNAKNDDQKEHLANLKMIETMFIEKSMESFKAGA